VEHTWDGLPVARDKPYAACVVVWRRGLGGPEFLVLHRLAPGGATYEGEWAWTPPSGARLPEEPVEQAAARELLEETGLALQTIPLQPVTDDVALFVAEAPPDATVRVDAEHDRYEWLALDDACARCRPAVVADGLRRAAAGVV
jgi:8-oxo-dGTP pyrophosphatase MutT (NUDIX family)